MLPTYQVLQAEYIYVPKTVRNKMFFPLTTQVYLLGKHAINRNGLIPIRDRDRVPRLLQVPVHCHLFYYVFFCVSNHTMYLSFQSMEQSNTPVSETGDTIIKIILVLKILASVKECTTVYNTRKNRCVGFVDDVAFEMGCERHTGQGIQDGGRAKKEKWFL